MKYYIVFFNGEYQGEYTAHSLTGAYRQAARDYGMSLDAVIQQFGNHYTGKESQK